MSSAQDQSRCEWLLPSHELRSPRATSHRLADDLALYEARGAPGGGVIHQNRDRDAQAARFPQSAGQFHAASLERA
jgi:hypothetical protein